MPKQRKVLAFDTHDNEIIIEFSYPYRRTQYLRRYDAPSVRRLGNLAWELVHCGRVVMGPTISRVGWVIRELI